MDFVVGFLPCPNFQTWRRRGEGGDRPTGNVFYHFTTLVLLNKALRFVMILKMGVSFLKLLVKFEKTTYA